MQQRYLEKVPVDGDMVLCRGRISVYEPRGDYQLIIDAMDFHGAGALQLAYEQLKNKLAAAGLFDADGKKELPPFPRHITLVTSPTGAAVHDFITIAQSRNPGIRITIYPAAVQGETAPAEISRAVRDINRKIDTDIIVLCRGGGSIEDLWAFNDEQLARTIHDSALPVVSAVGHEIDFTIADFAADVRSPTPSGAAEMLVPDISGLIEWVKELQQRLCRTMLAMVNQYDGQLSLYRQQLSSATHPLDSLLLRLDHLAGNLEHAVQAIITSRQTRLQALNNRLQQNSPVQLMRLYQQHIAELHRRLTRTGSRIISEKEQALAANAGLLDAVSPLATLSRGYSIARKTNAGKPVITRSSQVKKGENIEIILHSGKLDCTVTAAMEEERNKQMPPAAD
jgi:exodeoxyribonuclease VII large subunit